MKGRVSMNGPDFTKYQLVGLAIRLLKGVQCMGVKVWAVNIRES